MVWLLLDVTFPRIYVVFILVLETVLGILTKATSAEQIWLFLHLLKILTFLRLRCLVVVVLWKTVMLAAVIMALIAADTTAVVTTIEKIHTNPAIIAITALPCTKDDTVTIIVIRTTGSVNSSAFRHRRPGRRIGTIINKQHIKLMKC
uniref:Uncharacterized protein n=1 Tax=Romanomermis culicivorax TaxID=13658 RepID=A0A915IUG6_ROMCU